jgi:SAM-dependent methyltransferase
VTALPDATLPAPGRAFDGLAPRYDERFTDTALGRQLRRRVWQACDEAFTPGGQLLDLGAGTGADALHFAQCGWRVHALDASLAMARQTRAKLLAAGLADRVSVEARRIEDVGDLAGGALFDGALSDFGALNCVPDLPALAGSLAPLLRSGAPLVAVVMGPICAWEVAWFAAHRQPAGLRRRWSRGGSRAQVAGQPLWLHYPSPRTLASAFAPWFRVRRTWGLGVALPPSDAADWVAARPRLARWLARLEDRSVGFSPTAWIADHHVTELLRTDVGA